MKDYLQNLVKQTSSPVQAKNILREYLQARISRKLHADLQCKYTKRYDIYDSL